MTNHLRTLKKDLTPNPYQQNRKDGNYKVNSNGSYTPIHSDYSNYNPNYNPNFNPNFNPPINNSYGGIPMQGMINYNNMNNQMINSNIPGLNMGNLNMANLNNFNNMGMNNMNNMNYMNNMN